MKGLRIYVVALLALTAVAWCVVGFRVSILHETYASNSLFVWSGIRFSDFTALSERVAHFGEPNMLLRTDFKTPYPYPIPSVYAFLFFVRLFPNPLVAYLTFALLFFVIAACFLSWRVYQIAPGKLPQLAVWSTLLVGFPLLFLLDRANIEAVIWVLILLGIVAYARNRTLTSAILWAIAASMKIFPGLLFALFLARRQYRMFAIAIAATVAFSLLALAGVGPTIRQAAADNAKNTPWFVNHYILARNLEFDHSLFEATKQIVYVYAYEHRRSPDYPAQIRATFQKSLRLYDILIPLAALLLYWFRLRRMPILNQFLAYMILCTLLPQVSYEYRLVYVYLVWGAFLLFLLSDVATGRVEIPAKAIHRILFSSAVIFVPLSYLQFGHSFNFGSQIKTAFLLLILWTVLRIPMPSSLFGDLLIPATVNGVSGE